MLNQLFKLYTKHRTKTPLEDFTTEAFAGLLNLEEEIKNDFTHIFLGLPQATYTINTQVHYELENDSNCIVDLIFQSEGITCLVENKVNSKEGVRQLDRYGKILDTYQTDTHKTYLFYCTKYFDNKGYVDHNFKQFRWFQIANFLRKYSSNKLIQEFINFLTTHNMAQELTFDAKDFVTLENLQNLLNLTSGYMDRVKPLFENTFKTSSKISDGRTFSQVVNHNRLIYYYKDILSEGGWTEIKYGFKLHPPTVYIGLWIDKSNKQFSTIKDRLATETEFIIDVISNGISIELRKNVSIYLNNDQADFEITEWFKESFQRFSDLVKRLQDLEWKINVV